MHAASDRITYLPTTPPAPTMPLRKRTAYWVSSVLSRGIARVQLKATHGTHGCLAGRLVVMPSIIHPPPGLRLLNPSLALPCRTVKLQIQIFYLGLWWWFCLSFSVDYSCLSLILVCPACLRACVCVFVRYLRPPPHPILLRASV